MAKKRKFYTVSGMKRVCMGTDTLSYPNLFTSKKAAAKFVADRMNEAIDEFNQWPNHAHTEHIKAADGGLGLTHPATTHTHSHRR